MSPRRASRTRPPWVDKEAPGLSAKFDEDCPRCPDPIRKGDRIVFVRGRRVHVRCYGAGDE
ncbi:MAG TPA: hypothetical protein VF062_19510 [Candidatus Limnocylindrales bacterium]